ncbi:2-nitropropane dioxygenase [Deinococcus marmoris]|uniref:2-nitropropane dioxygenase n=1 Tax=Deinococcus marmoris TaxID=249408 RepID=UPI0004952D08|nr:2-nitropropane dioxygenase [Deinococcus marmoris]
MTQTSSNTQPNIPLSAQITAPLPQIIQGGMGVGISHWGLAQAVSQIGQLGIVSCTGIDNVLVRRLQDGDKDGGVRRALAAYPSQERAEKVIKMYFLPEGREPGQSYRRVPLPTVTKHGAAWELGVMGSFVEVFLAREGHDNPVGVNLLTKLQLHTVPALYGAMLAGADTVIMGAGIPREIPGVLDAFAAGGQASIKLDVKGGDAAVLTFDPADYGLERRELPRPKFYPIVTSHILAGVLMKKASGSVEGFIIEGPTAGGHNAPPRGTPTFDESGQPIYGERDIADLDEMKKLGLPFWLAGSRATPEALQEALARGAAGIQVGTLFAYCADSGLRNDLREQVHVLTKDGGVEVYTDPLASPTGFPFKVVQVDDTLARVEQYLARPRVCDIGYLREAYAGEDGKTGLRCAAEPVDAYLSKGGKIEDTVGRKCLCNALMTDAGYAQVQKGGYVEDSLMTSGDSLNDIAAWPLGYKAEDVVEFLLGRYVPGVD